MGDPLTHDRLFELIADVESAVLSLRNVTVDGVYALEEQLRLSEARVRILERKLREAQGEIGRLGSIQRQA